MTKTHLVPTGTMAAALSAVLPKISGTTYFDPTDTLEDHLGMQPQTHSRVMNSMAWMLDNSCISQARTILFNRFKEVDPNEVKDFNAFCQDISENLSHESLYETESDEQTLAIMLSVRNHWHDAAARAAHANDTDYKSKSLRQLMEEEKPREANIGTRTNFQQLAKDEAGDDIEKAKRLYESYVLGAKLASEQQVDNNKKLMTTILEVLRTVKRYAPEEARFDQLPLTVQRRLTQFTVTLIERTRVEMASRLASQPIAFGRMREATLQTINALNKVLTTKFSLDGELENITSQTQTDMDRNAKRKAVCSID